MGFMGMFLMPLFGAMMWLAFVIMVIVIVAFILFLVFTTTGLILIIAHPDKTNKSHRGRRKAGFIILSIGLVILFLLILFFAIITILGSIL